MDRPPRFDYHLTDLGGSLGPMREFGDRHLADASGPPLKFQHTCGAVYHAVGACRACGQVARRGEGHGHRCPGCSRVSWKSEPSASGNAPLAPLASVAAGTVLVLVTYVTPLATLSSTARDLSSGPVANAWNQAAMASGANNTAHYLGASGGITLFDMIATNTGSDITVGWGNTVLVAVALMIAGAFAILLLHLASRRGEQLLRQ